MINCLGPTIDFYGLEDTEYVWIESLNSTTK